MTDYGWIWRLFFGANIILLLLALVAMLVYVLAYILISIGLYKAAQKRNMQYPWLSWIPFARQYLIGQMLGNELKVTPTLKVPYFQYVLPGAAVLAVLASGSFLGGLLGLVSVALAILAYAALFKLYQEPNAIVYGVLTGIPFLEIIGSFFVLKLGDKPAPDLSTDTTVFPQQ